MLTKILQGTVKSMVNMLRDGCSVTDSCGREVKLSHIVVLNNGEVSGFIPGVRCQSLNALRLMDGELYISDQSVGGVIYGDLNVHTIEKYNDSVACDSLKIAHTEKVA